MGVTFPISLNPVFIQIFNYFTILYYYSRGLFFCFKNYTKKIKGFLSN